MASLVEEVADPDDARGFHRKIGRQSWSAAGKRTGQRIQLLATMGEIGMRNEKVGGGHPCHAGKQNAVLSVPEAMLPKFRRRWADGRRYDDQWDCRRFQRTRDYIWRGWERCCGVELLRGKSRASVLHLGHGGLRPQDCQDKRCQTECIAILECSHDDLGIGPGSASRTCTFAWDDVERKGPEVLCGRLPEITSRAL